MASLEWFVRGSTPLSRQDAGYLRRESAATPMHAVVGGPLTSRPAGAVTLAEARAHVAGRLPGIPALHQRLLDVAAPGSRPRWGAVADVDVEAHVLPWPKEDEGPLGLDAGLAVLTATPLPRDRPLWRVHVGAPTGGEPAPLAFVFHHALADGGLARRLLADVLAPVPPPAAPPPPTPPAAWRLGTIGRVEALRSRRGGGDPGRRGAAAPADALLAGPVRPGRRVASFAVPLARARAVGRATGGTVNDVYVAAVAAGLRTLLASRGGDPGRDPLVALLPRDVRDDADRQALGNRTATMFIDLPVGRARPADRLADVIAATREAKAATGSSGTADFRFDVTISNVRLVDRPHVCAGATVAPLVATAPLQGHNRLVVLGLGHGDHLAVACTADAEAFPDLPVLAEGIRGGFAELFDLAE